MNAKEWAKLLERDHYCLHCGATDAISPNHRANRGMGGSKNRDNPANLVVLCSVFNGAIESDSRAQALAKKYGWKLSSWERDVEAPVFDAIAGVWYLLDNKFGRIVMVLEGSNHERHTEDS